MPELELTRTREDRKLYALEGVGTLRLKGWMARTATATSADGVSWELARRGVFKTMVEAIDANDVAVGTFEPRTIRRGGELLWDGRTLQLRPDSAWKERYALSDGERELAILDGRGWGKRPVKVVVDDLAAVEPGLLLFAAYTVRGLAEDSGSAAGGTAAATSAASSG